PKRAGEGHREGASAQGRAEFPGGGAKRARGTGMMAGGGGSAVAGGSAPHIPVLGRPAVDFLNVHDRGIYIDGTFGAGGYTRAILSAPNCKEIAIHPGQSALAQGAQLGEEAQGPLTLIEGRFSNLDALHHEFRYGSLC